MENERTVTATGFELRTVDRQYTYALLFHIKLSPTCFGSDWAIIREIKSKTLYTTRVYIFIKECNSCITTILPVVLYGCETWSLILSEERKLRIFENRVLRWIFGPKRDEVTGECRRLHNKELYALLLTKYSGDQRSRRWGGYVARMGTGKVHTGFQWRNLTEGDHLEDSGADAMIILKQIFEKWDGGMDCINLSHERDRWWAVVNAVMNLLVP
jgi:hypothetical protein